jgi:stage III sporulation protein AA
MDEKTAAARFDNAARNLGTLSERFNLPIQVKAHAQEIRLRTGRPIMLSLPDGPVFITLSGQPAFNLRSGLLIAEKANIDEAFRLICDCSVHSHQREIRNGFVTLRGGHRAGICGTAVTEGDEVSNIRDISSINLRIARDISGAADKTVSALLKEGGVSGALIFGPPGCGKTTVLRDLARQLSSGGRGARMLRVAVIDERGEIAATFQGQPQNDLGPCCDVLDGYPKGEGIMQAVRCLSPDVVICDEIGGEADEKAVEFSLNAGVTIIASAHAGSLSELMARPQTARLIACGAFKMAVHLSGREHPGVVAAVYGEDCFKKNNLTMTKMYEDQKAAEA